MADEEMNKEEEAAMESARQAARKRELQRADIEGKRPRDEALEKWGPVIEAEIERDLERERKKQPKLPDKLPTPGRQPKKDGPDMDMG
jgi:hypothetical protein